MEQDALQKIGFTEKEAKIYLAIMEKGRIPHSAIARITGINRSTVYSVAKDLIKKNVIIEDVGDKQSYLTALPPQNLSNVIREEERALKNKKRVIDETIKNLEVITKNTKCSIPKIHFVYEEDLEDFTYKQSPEWDRSVMERGGTWWGFQDPSYVQHYQKYIDWYWNKCAPKKLLMKLLTNRSEPEQEMLTRKYEHRIIKFWDKSHNFSATTWINGDYLVMIRTDQRPHYLVQIHDPVLAHNMREMFKGVWANL